MCLARKSRDGLYFQRSEASGRFRMTVAAQRIIAHDQSSSRRIVLAVALGTALHWTELGLRQVRRQNVIANRLVAFAAGAVLDMNEYPLVTAAAVLPRGQLMRGRERACRPEVIAGQHRGRNVACALRKD